MPDAPALPDPAATVLFDKIHGALLAGAIGDAMGGPVEGLNFREIDARYGRVERFLPYDRQPSPHGAFSMAAGTVTDDTRLRMLLCDALVAAGDLPTRGELAAHLVAAYHHATDERTRGFYEEYALKALHGGAKLIFAGEMTNGAIMMNAPIGLVCPADPDAAFAAAFDLAFLTDGYAKHAAATMAAAVAAALAPGATVDGVVASALAALKRHRDRFDGPVFRAWHKYYRPNEEAVERAVEIAARRRDVFAVREEFYDALRRGPMFSEASQTLAVALGMFVAAGGDLSRTIVGAVNYGRDNDSYASVAGGLAGALHGTQPIPRAWRDEVVAANPLPSLAEAAAGVWGVARRRFERQRGVVAATAPLFASLGTRARHVAQREADPARGESPPEARP